MKHLLQWMDGKMTARLGSGATICKTGSTTRPSINLLGADGNGNSPVNVTKIRSSATYVKQVTTLMSAHNLKQ